jgi:general secretion pathway protein G
VTGKGLTARRTGFTLIELLVVIAIIATLLAIAVPRYFNSLDRAKEAVLKENLSLMRDALQKYYSDKGKYPETLDELERDKYLRKIPVDPITGTAASWVGVAAPDPEKGVADVRSGAPGKTSAGEAYGDW